MTASPRRFPLTASHNRKRRSVHPIHHHQNQQEKSTTTPNTSFFSQKKMIDTTATATSSAPASLDRAACENNRTDQPEPMRFTQPQVQETREEQPSQQEPTQPEATTSSTSDPVVFRSALWLDSDSDDDDDLWTLKRASPICEDDDEFFQYESPTKRSKVVSALDWQDRLSDEVPLLLNVAATR